MEIVKFLVHETTLLSEVVFPCIGLLILYQTAKVKKKNDEDK